MLCVLCIFGFIIWKKFKSEDRKISHLFTINVQDSKTIVNICLLNSDLVFTLNDVIFILFSNMY